MRPPGKSYSNCFSSFPFNCLKSVVVLLLLIATHISLPVAAQEWIGGEQILYNYPLDTRVGIGTTNPQAELDVDGTIRMSGFSLIESGGEPQAGMVLTRDETGGGNWEAIPFRWQKSGNQLHYTQGNVGIGTASPASKLSVNGDIEINGSRLFVGTDGKVGIGTNDPGNMLHVYKSGGGGMTGLRLQYDFTGTPNGHSHSEWLLQAASSGGSFHISDNVTPRLVISAGGNVGIGDASPASRLSVNGEIDISGSRLHVDAASGNVGIGTANPGTYKLAVNGTIRSKEIVVETGWSDFVFEDDYRLPSLEEVEAHINAYKHLPGIPSAKEVEANGVSLGEMQSKLLQKIEELTLYVIELKKENEGQKQLIETLQEQVGQLKRYRR